ncbi:MAG: hypothetical protein LBQ54_07120 [Planctomycetaceae bacterium]|jgi:hypothetical protein|nr:hypothetical protein [Planctomycetaceae bacterium]
MKNFIFVLLFSFFVLGCNNNNPQGRVAARGEVTFDGKVLEQSSIQFSSLPGLSPNIITGTQIKQGKFEITAVQGLIPGQEYLVQINSPEEVPGTQIQDEIMGTIISEYSDIIPSKYNTDSKKLLW